MKDLLPVLIVLACPLMMIFMMREMHGGSSNQTGHVDHQMGTAGHMGHEPPPADDRIAELEREVARLKAERGDFDRWEAGQ
jgi:hypothetical protein